MMFDVYHKDVSKANPALLMDGSAKLDESGELPMDNEPKEKRMA